MNGVQFYRDAEVPFFELKTCHATDLSYKKHSHEEYSLGIMDGGQSSFWYDGKFAEVCPPTYVFIPPEVVHSCNPLAKSQWRYTMLFVSPTWVHGLADSHIGQNPIHPIIKNELDMEVLRGIKTLISSLADGVSPLEKEANLVTLMEQVFHDVKRVTPWAQSKERSNIASVREYLASCFLDRITLDHLAATSGINKYRIIRLFKEEYQIPPHTFQTLLRINYAKRELRKQRPITDIAVESGFYDQSHFCKVFKSHTGVTPEKYQILQ